MKIINIDTFIADHSLVSKRDCSSGHTVQIFETSSQTSLCKALQKEDIEKKIEQEEKVGNSTKYAVKAIGFLKEAIGEMIAYNLLEKLGVCVPEERFIAQNTKSRPATYYLITNFVGEGIKDNLASDCVVQEEHVMFQKGTLFPKAFSQIQGHAINEKRLIGLQEHLMAFVITGDNAIVSSDLSNGRLIPHLAGFKFCKIDPYNDTSIFDVSDNAFTSLMIDLKSGEFRNREWTENFNPKGFGCSTTRGNYPLFPFSAMQDDEIIASARKVCVLTDADILNIVTTSFPEDVEFIDGIPKKTLIEDAYKTLIYRRDDIKEYIKVLQAKATLEKESSGVHQVQSSTSSTSSPQMNVKPIDKNPSSQASSSLLSPWAFWEKRLAEEAIKQAKAEEAIKPDVQPSAALASSRQSTDMIPRGSGHL